MLLMLIQLAVFAAVYGATGYGIMKVFEKVDRTIPNWAAFVPFYNLYVLVTVVAKKEPVWVLIALIPVVGFVLISLDIAKKFGKEQGFGIGMGLVPFVFYPLLGTSEARYEAGAEAAPVRVRAR